MNNKEIVKKLDKLELVAFDLRFGITDEEDKKKMEELHEEIEALYNKYLAK